MRNDFIGTSIDGDARAACGCHGNNANTINTAGCGCEGNRQARCGCSRPGYNTGCDKCENGARQNRNYSCGECENDHPRHSRSTGCDKCESNSRQSCGHSYGECGNDHACHGRSNGCECESNGCQAREHGCDQCDEGYRRGRTPAMVYAQHHDLDNMYCAEKALLRGTLFGCLDKPMCNERCTDDACSTQCQEDKFAIWELRLYLNTHPCDKQALALLRKLTEQMDDDCTCSYTSDCSRWSWLDGPWPWEYQRCCGKEA